jgi:hypothetical protein
MLPALPKAQKILDNEWNKRMFAAKDKVFPTHTTPKTDGGDYGYQLGLFLHFPGGDAAYEWFRIS